MSEHRKKLAQSRRWVIKIGSALLTNDGRGLDHDAIAGWVGQMAQLRSQGVELLLVSSGAIAEGMQRLGWKQRPHSLCDLQAAAAVGQMGLIQAYESAFQKHDMHTAQILLTHDDLSNRQRYLNARSTLRGLIGHSVIPVVNENDTVITDEIRFGDNDSLAGLVANLVEADLLVILTDQQGLYSTDPRHNPDAQLVSEAVAGDDKLWEMAGDSASFGRGGMRTKLQAARLASRSGTATIIASGREQDVLTRIVAAEELGTALIPARGAQAARKQWLSGQLQSRGQLQLDAGAIKVLQDEGRSLLAVGVTAVSGNFSRGELVICVDDAGDEMARGLVNYSAEESRMIMGHASDKIESILGYVDEPELIHRDNLVLS
ncbi:MAG: glutamate 5-kinase [Gammaproteobacteria bacterium]|nr:MAG: glutamate 5-kinase [Gammaproteobacteria bacterium]